MPKKKFCGKEQVAKEVAGGLNGFGALLVMRKLMALLGRLMIGLWLWLRLKVAAQRRKCKCNSNSEIVHKEKILKFFLLHFFQRLICNGMEKPHAINLRFKFQF